MQLIAVQERAPQVLLLCRKYEGDYAMNHSQWTLKKGPGPMIAVANHHRHDLRPPIAKFMALHEASRLRDEGPFTREWADVAPTCLVTQHSRFEVDLNRPPETAIHLTADDAWQLQVSLPLVYV